VHRQNLSLLAFAKPISVDVHLATLPSCMTKQ
jgi:hypothetical protein